MSKKYGVSSNSSVGVGEVVEITRTRSDGYGCLEGQLLSGDWIELYNVFHVEGELQLISDPSG